MSAHQQVAGPARSTSTTGADVPPALRPNFVRRMLAKKPRRSAGDVSGRRRRRTGTDLWPVRTCPRLFTNGATRPEDDPRTTPDQGAYATPTPTPVSTPTAREPFPVARCRPAVGRRPRRSVNTGHCGRGGRIYAPHVHYPAHRAAPAPRFAPDNDPAARPEEGPQPPGGSRHDEERLKRTRAANRRGSVLELQIATSDALTVQSARPATDSPLRRARPTKRHQKSRGPDSGRCGEQGGIGVHTDSAGATRRPLNEFVIPIS